MEFGEIFPFAPEDGLLILALVNFLGSLIPFVPLPGFLLLATMSVGNEYNLHALALISAVSLLQLQNKLFSMLVLKVEES